MIDVSKMSFVSGFKPVNLVVLVEKGGKLICAFDGNWKGRDVFNIRELYEEYGDWNPGKGVMVPMDQKHDFLKGIVDFARELYDDLP